MKVLTKLPKTNKTIYFSLSLFIFSLFLISPTLASATTYYVSTSGSDTNDGLTESTPWQTISKVNGRTFSAGDNILFKRGDMWRGQTLTINWSGTEGNPITFGAYGTGEKPIFNGAEVITNWTLTGTPNVWQTPSGMGEGFFTVVVVDDNRFMPVPTLLDLDADLEYWVNDLSGKLNDMIYIYSEANPATRTAEVSVKMTGIDGDSSNTNITIQNIDFRYYGYVGIDFRDGQSNGNVLVDSCNFYFNHHAGVQFYLGYNNNTISNSMATYNGNGFYANIASNISFLNNIVTNQISYPVGAGFTDGHGIGAWRADNIIVENNYMDENVGGNVGIDSDTGNLNNITIRYNTLKGCSTKAISVVGGNYIIADSVLNVNNNLILVDEVNNRAFGMNKVFGRMNIYNNTIIQSASSDYLMYLYHADNIYFKNNIIYNSSGGARTGYIYIYYDGLMESDNNIWYDENSLSRFAGRGGIGTYLNLAAWVNGTSQDVTSFNTDPLFITEFINLQLQSGSPAINAGVDVGLTEDILGNPIIGLPDIGAYEFQTTPTPDTTIPTISSFTIPTTSTTLSVPITTFTATDNIGVTGYLLRESSTTPSAGSGPWTTTKPTSYLFTTEGTKTLYAWARDASGNVSLSSTDQVIITLPVVTPGGGGGGGGGGGSTTPTCSSTETLINSICQPNTTLSLSDKAKLKDVKRDGIINILDFNILMVNWNKNYTTETKEFSLSKGDLNQDGMIGILDVNQLMVYWGVKYSL